MILPSEYVLRAMELRMKTVPIVGTLCAVKDPTLIWNAMKYFQCWNYGQYISHPFIELGPEIYQNMDQTLFRIYIELLHHWMPPCTSDEIRSTIYYAEKFGYQVTRNQNYMSLRRVKYDPSINSPGYRDSTYRED
jgi:hypothetical protein